MSKIGTTRNPVLDLHWKCREEGFLQLFLGIIADTCYWISFEAISIMQLCKLSSSRNVELRLLKCVISNFPLLNVSGISGSVPKQTFIKHIFVELVINERWQIWLQKKCAGISSVHVFASIYNFLFLYVFCMFHVLYCSDYSVHLTLSDFT